jgi:hypothetical protein
MAPAANASKPARLGAGHTFAKATETQALKVIIEA